MGAQRTEQEGRRATAAGLPQPLTSFVGREEEVRELLEMLGRPTCRLITLLGPGGVGKTRLALEAARRWSQTTGTGVRFVPLDGVSEPARLGAAVGAALELRGASHEDVHEQIISYLRDREMLLVLDNFEHLTEAAGFVAGLLQATDGLKVLVTSREALNLSTEWRFSVRGLSVSAGSDVESPAVSLFVERAKRLDPDLSLEKSGECIQRICRILDGMPLGIELAASWAGSFTCAEILGTLEAGIDSLGSRMRDLPLRHRSIQGVFEQSWSRLSPAEQDVLSRLCAFRGGFDREAAGEVAGATPALLTSLIDRSLLWRDAEGRLHMHDLIRQCVEHLLKTAPDALADARDRHSRYYTQLLRRLLPDLIGPDAASAADRIALEEENALAALDRALAAGDFHGLGHALHAISTFWQEKGRYGDAYREFQKAASALRDREQTAELLRERAIIELDLAWFCIRLGHLDEARRAAERSSEAYRQCGERPLPGVGTDPDIVLGVISLVEGDYPAAEELGARSLKTAQAQGQQWNLEYAYYVLSEAAYGTGRYEKAKEYGLGALQASQETGDVWFRAYCLVQLGNAAAALGDRKGAREYYTESFELRKQFSDPDGMGLALNRLGQMALASRNYREAERLFADALVLYHETDDLGGRATALKGLGDACLGAGRYPQAASRFRDALSYAREIRFARLIVSLAVAAAELLHRSGDRGRALEVLGWAANQPAADDDTRRRAKALFSEMGATQGTADASDIVPAAASLEADLVRLSQRWVTAAQQLAEPLSQREIEVLECIAEGLSNKEVADRLYLSIGTVKAHTHTIYSKLGADNRVKALARAREAGVLPP